MNYTLHHGNCLDILPTLDDCSIDSIVTDPPYGLEFMGKDWDAPWKGKASKEFNEIEKGSLGGFTKLPNHSRVNNVKCAVCDKWKFSSSPCICEKPQFPNARLNAMTAFQDWFFDVAVECLRVLKPGGHLLAFGGTRTYHRMACAIEDAGFEIRDSIHWIYGSGFPKSLDVSKAIDKQAGAEREVIGKHPNPGGTAPRKSMGDGWQDAPDITAPATEQAKRWSGWGTALKPAHEPVVVARKPLEGTVAGNVLRYGTGAINIDASRIGHASEQDLAESLAKNPGRDETITSGVYGANRPQQSVNTAGRWPANIIIDDTIANSHDDWPRYFYCAKPSRRERNAGLDHLDRKPAGVKNDSGRGFSESDPHREIRYQNHHPTVKPLALMRYLVRLVTPPDGIVLDPFAGSGTTLMAAILENFTPIGIEMTEEYLPIIKGRIAWAIEEADRQPDQQELDL